MTQHVNKSEWFLPSGCLSEKGLRCLLEKKTDQALVQHLREHLKHCELCSLAVQGFGSVPDDFDFEETRQLLHDKIGLLIDNESATQPHSANQNEVNILSKMLLYIGKWRNIAALIPLMILLGSFLWLTAALQLVNHRLTGISDYYSDTCTIREVPTEIEEITHQGKESPPIPKIASFRIQDSEIAMEDEVNIEIIEEFKFEPHVQIPLDQENDVETEVFILVEEPPRFPGGHETLNRFLADNLRYPASAKQAGVSGTVFITFVIEPDGKVNDAGVLRGVNKVLDEEALRVIRIMPDWVPGKQHGKAVKVRFTIPVTFKLQ